MTHPSRSPYDLSATIPRIAAVVYERSEQAESAMQAAVACLRQRDVRVDGLVQLSLRENPDARCRVVLENIGTGGHHDLTQNLGSGSQSCALDAHVLADASRVIREALAGDAQLVVISKFGALEASGGGFRDEFMQVAGAGVPLLTSVSSRLIEPWNAFTGELAQALPPCVEAIVAWWDALHGSHSGSDQPPQASRAPSSGPKHLS